MPKGIAPKSKNGRRRPQRVFTRSLSAPMRGSLMLSQMRPMSKMVPPMLAGSPTTLVRKKNQKRLRAVVAAEAPQSPNP